MSSKNARSKKTRLGPKRKRSSIHKQHDVKKRPSRQCTPRKKVEAGVTMTHKTDNPDQKRPCISWDQYFMGVAFMASQRSKDPVTQVGSCIVNNEKRIISTGHNGMPNRCNDDIMPWGKHDTMNNKHHYVCHSELNAILNKTSSDVRGATLYVTLYPCNQCARYIIQAGIKKIVFYNDDKHPDSDATNAVKYMFAVAGIKTRKYTPSDLPLQIGSFESQL